MQAYRNRICQLGRQRECPFSLMPLERDAAASSGAWAQSRTKTKEKPSRVLVFLLNNLVSTWQNLWDSQWWNVNPSCPLESPATSEQGYVTFWSELKHANWEVPQTALCRSLLKSIFSSPNREHGGTYFTARRKAGVSVLIKRGGTRGLPWLKPWGSVLPQPQSHPVFKLKKTLWIYVVVITGLFAFSCSVTNTEISLLFLHQWNMTQWPKPKVEVFKVIPLRRKGW